jgi:hypothetical protein
MEREKGEEREREREREKEGEREREERGRERNLLFSLSFSFLSLSAVRALEHIESVPDGSAVVQLLAASCGDRDLAELLRMAPRLPIGVREKETGWVR